jgi:hypothetical protein
MSHGYEQWDMFNAVMAAGWAAVTVPIILSNRSPGYRSTLPEVDPFDQLRMQREIQETYPELISRDAKNLVLLMQSKASKEVDKGVIKAPKQVALARIALRNPQGAASHVLARVKKKIYRRMPEWLPNLIGRVTSMRDAQS